MAAILANANDKPTMAAATSIYDPKHRKALEDFTQRLLTQVHHRYDIPYEYLLRDIYDTMVWSAPAPPSATPRSKKITCDATPVKPKTMKPKTPTQTNATPEEESKKAINKESKKKSNKDIQKDSKKGKEANPSSTIKKKKKLRHLELLVVDDGEPFWVDARTGLLYTYKDKAAKLAIASLHPTLGGSSSGSNSLDPSLAPESCSKSKIWM